MGNIAVHEFIALDGMCEDPSRTVEYGFKPEMGETFGVDHGFVDGDRAGRKTFEMFAPPDHPHSQTPCSTQSISGSSTLVRALVRDGLIDELHLIVYPLALAHTGRAPRSAPSTRALAQSATPSRVSASQHVLQSSSARAARLGSAFGGAADASAAWTASGAFAAISRAISTALFQMPTLVHHFADRPRAARYRLRSARPSVDIACRQRQGGRATGTSLLPAENPARHLELSEARALGRHRNL